MLNVFPWRESPSLTLLISFLHNTGIKVKFVNVNDLAAISAAIDEDTKVSSNLSISKRFQCLILLCLGLLLRDYVEPVVLDSRL